ncbi:disease resistance protein RUN1 [Trifolium repens]|nr:disease resistance protein RUN1 [Trifolium repens]
MAMESLFPSSSFSSRFKYHVFLSFRGSDTRRGFIGHLYKALTDKGIHTFIDDEHLQRGDEITPSLNKAIEESMIFIPVFSINYASSSFCLDELVQIIQCHKTKGRLVLPVFYDVEPTHVRHQTGSYGEHLAKHENSFQNNNENMERLKQWKVALKVAANLSGNHFIPGNDYEHNFIEKIVKDVSDKINRVPLYIADYLVGLESRISEVNSLLDLESDDGVCIIGIHGTGEHMGKEIVRRESPKEPGERSRLWFHDDIVHVLKENTGTSKIEIIHFNSPSSVVDWNGKAFKKMKNLKILIIKNGRFSQGARNLPKNLRVLEWVSCPLKSLSFRISDKKLENIVLLTLDRCNDLINILDVSGLQNLRKFSFRECVNLIKIHKSIGHLNKLEFLYASDCIKLESFPPLQLTSLKELDLSFCTSLKNLPKFKNLNQLSSLNIDGCRKLTYSSKIFMMPNLVEFTAEDCSLLLEKHNEKFSSMETSKLRSSLLLKNNNLTEQSVQVVLSLWRNVFYLDLSNNNFKFLPECLNQCQIEALRLDGCKYLEEIRGIPLNLTGISAKGCKSLTSSSTRMLLSQEQHLNYMILPSRSLKMIPDWFQHQIRGSSISFWFRKQLPSIRCIILLIDPKPSFINFGARFKSKLDEALLKNEWIHAEVKIVKNMLYSVWNDEVVIQSGVHVIKHLTRMDDIQFTDSSLSRKRKLVEHLLRRMAFLSLQ